MSKTSVGVSAFLIAVMVGIALIISNTASPTKQCVTCEKCNGTGHIVTKKLCERCIEEKYKRCVRETDYLRENGKRNRLTETEHHKCTLCNDSGFVTVTNLCDDCIDGMQYK